LNVDKQEALNFMWENCRAPVAPEKANEIRAAWGLKPVKGVRAGAYRAMVTDPDALAVSVDAVALAIATKLECPEFSNPMQGVGSAAEWDVLGCCVQIALKEGLTVPGKIYPGLATALKSAGVDVPKEVVE
jgi:hypothetical protein